MNPTPLTLGARLDALLEPFAQDESRLNHRLAELGQLIAELEAEASQAREDLQVVESAKIDALRAAAEEDPLLRVAFRGVKPPAPGSAPAPVSASAPGIAPVSEQASAASNESDHAASSKAHRDEPALRHHADREQPRHRLLAVSGA